MRRPHPVATVVAAAAVAFAASCGPGASPAQGPAAVLREFLGTLQAGDEAKARTLLVAAERSDPHVTIRKESVAKGYTVGAETVDGDRAEVPVTLPDAPRPLVQVLLREQGQWRLSMHATMQKMTGIDPEGMKQAIQGQLQQLGTRLQKQVQDSARAGLATPR